jgi:hypothetical protein
MPADAKLPSRAAVEHTLTSGYAYALDLEGRRLRIERSLRTLLRDEAKPDPDEIAALSALLDRAVEELAAVRALLASLRSHALA